MPAADGGGSAYEYEEEIEVSPEDEAALAAFLAPGAADYRQRTLSDLILEKIRQHQEERGLETVPRCVGGAWGACVVLACVQARNCARMRMGRQRGLGERGHVLCECAGCG